MHDSQRTRVRWILIGWIFLVSAVAYLDRVNLSIAGSAIMAEFHLDTVQLGWVQTAFVLGYALFQAPAGRLADRIGPRLIIALGVVWWAIFTSALTVIPVVGASLVMLIIIRFGLGIGEAVVYPASNTLVAAWIPSTERGLANGFIFTGVGFGAGITPPIITAIRLHYGWRASFWFSAAIGLIVGLVWYLISRDKPEQHPWASKAEKDYIQAGLPKSSSKLGGEKMGWSEIIRNKDIMAVSFSYFTFGYAAYIFFSWFFIYLNVVRGLDQRQTASWSMLPFLAMAIGSASGGWISDLITKRLGKRAGRCMLALVGIGLSAFFIALGTQVASPQMAVMVLAAGAGSLYLSQSSFWSISADIGKKSAGSVSGVMNMCGQFGGALTASLTPYLGKTFGWNVSFLVAAGLCAVGAVAWLFVHPEADEVLPVEVPPVEVKA
ncbi:MAG TPA: MFS transporter [Bryobacteraceae bacterium]|nr:MFS transporter [Bryobacteraceae bacterium]